MLELGRYRLIRPIGRGGMAEIWKAKTTGPQGFVKVLALKMILPEIADERLFMSMLVDEAKLAASLVHPNLVSVFDFGEVDGRLILAMEYIAGANLDRVMSRLHKAGGVLEPEVAVYVALQACLGLGHAHARTLPDGTPLGIVHRDVSPQNLLVSASGDVKVSDFGIAKAASALMRTAAGQVRGKLAYMSPEQLARSTDEAHTLDGRSDLFSLGIVLYEMIGSLASWRRWKRRTRTAGSAGRCSISRPRSRRRKKLEAAMPAHEVAVGPFEIAVYPVTKAQWGRFVAETGAKAADGPKAAPSDSFVTGISQHEARAYALHHQLDLPTEAEWEAAARDGRGFFPWGDAFFPTGRAAYQGPLMEPYVVGTRAATHSVRGVHDLIGQFGEYTCEPFGPYPGADVAGFDELFPSWRDQIAVRGGYDPDQTATCVSRRGVPSGERRTHLKFRCVRRA